MSRALLAHLAHRFVSQKEDLATEALLFILEKSPRAKEALQSLINDLGGRLEGEITFASQVVGDSGERPDLVGLIAGEEKLLVEIKFWAGLTQNQPVGYLKRLENSGGPLVFVVPETRLRLVWSEILRRVEESNGSYQPVIPTDLGMATRVGNSPLIIVSWNTVLSRVEHELKAASEYTLIESLEQLRQLCINEDEVAFHPLTSEELTSSLPRRIMQFSYLIDKAVDELVSNGIASVKGLRAASGRGWYGRYMRLWGAGCLLHLSARKWSTEDMTPIWLRVKDHNWETPVSLIQTFDKAQQDGLLKYHDNGKGIEIPIFLSVQQEEQYLIAEISNQVVQIGQLMQEAGVIGNADSESKVEPPPDDSA